MHPTEARMNIWEVIVIVIVVAALVVWFLRGRG
jgi:hypothetical protein